MVRGPLSAHLSKGPNSWSCAPYWQILKSSQVVLEKDQQGSWKTMTFTIFTVLGQPTEVSCRMLWELFQTSHGTPLLFEGPIPCHLLPLQLGDSWNVEALRKDTPCRSEGTLAKNALQPVEMWSCQGSRCCTLCLPLQRCESKVVLVGRCRNICTYDICTLHTEKEHNYPTSRTIFNFFFPVILVSWQHLLNRHQIAGRYFSPHPLATGASRTYIYISYAHPPIK